MKTRVGLAVLLALAAAGGCTKQTAGTSGATSGATASTPESLIIQQATQTPAMPAAAPSEPALAAAPAAPVDTTAAASAAATSKTGSAQEIQQALKQAGFYQGAIDGKIGPKTQQAIKEFQQAHQLKVDGKVGPRTWAALQPYLTASAGAAETSSTQLTYCAFSTDASHHSPRTRYAGCGVFYLASASHQRCSAAAKMTYAQPTITMMSVVFSPTMRRVALAGQ